jgi:hypothetical protein
MPTLKAVTWLPWTRLRPYLILFDRPYHHLRQLTNCLSAANCRLPASGPQIFSVEAGLKISSAR